MSTRRAVTRIDEALRPIGFNRHKATWNRSSGTYCDVIALQKSKSDDLFTINAGVLHPSVHAVCWGTPPGRVVYEPECTVRARIGRLIDNRDQWWPLDDTAALNQLGGLITAYVLPFLDRMHSPAAMETFLTSACVPERPYPPESIYLAALMSMLGKRVEACALLADLEKQLVGPWRAAVTDAAGRLRCSQGAAGRSDG